MNKETITIDLANDRDLWVIMQNALHAHHDTLNNRRRQLMQTLEDLQRSQPDHRDLPMLRESHADAAEQYERMYDLLIAVDHGKIVISYEDYPEV